MYLRLTWAALMLPKCSGCFLLVPEECMPPGAASREQQQQQRACVSTARQQPASQRAPGSVRFSRLTTLWWTPGGAGWRNPHVCFEMRLSMCGMCRGSSAVTDVCKFRCACVPYSHVIVHDHVVDMCMCVL